MTKTAKSRSLTWWRTAVSTAAVTSVVAIGFAVPSEAQLTVFCDGEAEGVTIPFNLVVDEGESCDLTDVIINGNATVRADANLFLTDSALNGNLTVQSNGFANTVESTITGNTSLTTAFGVYTEGSSHGVDVTATDSGFFYSLGSSVGRDVTSTDGETFLESSWVHRHLTTSGDLLTDLYDSVVIGNASVSDSELGSVICISEIDGAASFTGGGGIVQIGANEPLSGCGYNAFHSSLTVSDNDADIHIADNVIRGDFVCADNDPAANVDNNRVRGNDDCESGMMMMAMSARGASEDSATRRVAVEEKIEERADEGAAAAEAAGPAGIGTPTKSDDGGSSGGGGGDRPGPAPRR